MATTQASTERHVAVLAFPFGGHGLTMLNLVHRLARAAQDVHFSFLNTAKSNNSLFLVSKIDLPGNIKSYNVEDGRPKDHVLSGNPLDEVDLFLKVAQKNFKNMLDVVVAKCGRKVSCLLVDGFFSFVGAMANDIQVPWIPVWVPGPCDLSAHVYTDVIRQYRAKISSDDNDNGADIGHKSQTLEIIPGLSIINIDDLSEEILVNDLEDTLFSSMLSKLGVQLPAAATIVMNTFRELYSPALLSDLLSMFPHLLNVGFLTQPLPVPPLPLSDSDETGCLSWLDMQNPKSVVYISVGTVASLPQIELLELAEALEESGTPFLWALRDNEKSYLPDGFVQRTSLKGKIVPWAPQIQVLGHASVGVFVTHCGQNSINESIANEVPMICRPFFGDHRINGRLIEEIWEIGLRLEGLVFTKKGVLRCLKLILEEEEGKKMRKKLEALKELLLEAVGPRGGATRDFRTLVEKITML